MASAKSEENGNVFLKHWPRPFGGGRGGRAPRTLCGLSSRHHQDMYGETEEDVTCPDCRKRMQPRTSIRESAMNPLMQNVQERIGQIHSLLGVERKFAHEDLEEAKRSERVIGHTSSGKAIPHPTHALYNDRQHFSGYNGGRKFGVSPLTTFASSEHIRKMMHQRFPGWTAQDHQEAALRHREVAKEKLSTLSKQYSRADRRQIGPARYSGPDNSIHHGSDSTGQSRSYSGSNLAARNLPGAKHDESDHRGAAKAHEIASRYIRKHA